MIVVFPLLMDESINQNIVPGICKVLEKFIIVYELDAIMKMTGSRALSIGGDLTKIGVNAAATVAGLGFKIKHEDSAPYKPADEDMIVRNKNETDEAFKKRIKKHFGINYNEKHPLDIDEYKTKKARGTVQNVIDTMKGIKDIGTVKVDTPQNQSISVEPEYTLVTTTTGTKIVGIKVIPFPVKIKKGYSLADYLMVDSSLGKLDSLVLKHSRNIIRKFWALCRSVRIIPFLSSKSKKSITGNPEKDILWASTFHKRYVFCMLNYADITDSNFFKNAGGIRKLHGMGWNSFIAADDVNKRAIFCMKEFQGLCSSVPYQFLYSSVSGKGDNSLKIYETLEDVKKSASPFFKLSLSKKRIFGETKQIVKDYLDRIS